jgi:sec-independent protein translocase protein TatA
MGIGFTEGVLIAVIVLFFFGGKKIPQLGKTLGESMKGFKEGMKGDQDQNKDENKKS